MRNIPLPEPQILRNDAAYLAANKIAPLAASAAAEDDSCGRSVDDRAPVRYVISVIAASITRANARELRHETLLDALQQAGGVMMGATIAAGLALMVVMAIDIADWVSDCFPPPGALGAQYGVAGCPRGGSAAGISTDALGGPCTGACLLLLE